MNRSIRNTTRRAGSALAVAVLAVASSATLHADSNDPAMIGGELPEGYREAIRAKVALDESHGMKATYVESDKTGAGPARGAFDEQPAGALTGRIVFTSGGHGWTYDSEDDLSTAWYTQRGNNFDVVEDLGNADQLYFFAHYALNAGATVVPCRPVGRQVNEIVLDQDDTTAGSDGVVQYTGGSWLTSSFGTFYSKLPDSESYRFTTEVVAEPGAPTHAARYIPNIPEAGWYPVYTWVTDSNNRVNQQYLISHSGGVSEIRVNHRLVGKGWVWLGEYYFEAGQNSDRYVEITNSVESGETGSAIIADAIRFGNGMGDLDYGEGVSGFPRQDEQSRYWAITSQHPSSVWNSSGDHGADNVSTPPRMAAYMFNEVEGSFGDAVYVGFHSNAGGGRGADGLHNSNDEIDEDTPNQFLLALLMGREINQDFRQLDTQIFGHYDEWTNKTSHTYQASFPYGEQNGRALGAEAIDTNSDGIRDTMVTEAEMDASIIEVAFHDSDSDTDYLTDSLARRLLARSTLQAVIRYYEQAFTLSLTMPPDEPENLRAINAADGTGDIVLTWEAPTERPSGEAETPGNIGGDSPTGYAIYSSTNATGFGLEATVGNVNTYTVTGLSDGEERYFFVAATNAGGQSFPSNVAGATSVAAADKPGVLVVDGYDRLDMFMAVDQTVTGNPLVSDLGTFKRVYPHEINNYSYVIPHGQAIAAASVLNRFDSATNDAIIDGDVALADYDLVVWFVGEESTRDETFSTAEQTLVSNYFNGGGSLIVSGAEIGWDLDREDGSTNPTSADRTFFNSTFGADYASDDANVFDVEGVAGTPFAGISLTFDDGSNGIYDVEYPDVFDALADAQGVLVYKDGSTTVGNAAILFQPSGKGRAIILGFPFETIVSGSSSKSTIPAVSEALMDAMLDVIENGISTDVDGWELY